jgi:dTDP-4-dehydrorhamnose reductase
VKFLLFGRDGQVGRALQPALAPLGEVVALGHAEADLSQPESLGPLIARHRPDVIVNAAAYTAVDAAEDDRDRAWAINAGAVGVIGQAARTIGALVVHYSTDYVFDGTALDPQTEEQPTSPLGVYGASKLAGEVLLRDSGAGHLIFRTSWVYAPQGKNFPLTILRLAHERDTLNVVSDQVGAPTPAGLIARATVEALAAASADRGKLGLYHLAPTGETSWHHLAQYLVADAIAEGAQLKLTPEAIVPILARDYPTKALRPANSRLDTSKLRAAFGLTLPPWQEGIRQLIRTLKTEGRL